MTDKTLRYSTRLDALNVRIDTRERARDLNKLMNEYGVTKERMRALIATHHAYIVATEDAITLAENDDERVALSNEQENNWRVHETLIERDKALLNTYEYL